MTEHLSWKLIDDIAARKGVSEAARFKWRQRGVPPKWRIAIAQELPHIALADFDGLELTPGRIAA